MSLMILPHHPYPKWTQTGLQGRLSALFSNQGEAQIHPRPWPARARGCVSDMNTVLIDRLIMQQQRIARDV